MASPTSREENSVTGNVLYETHLNVFKASYTWTLYKFSQRQDRVGDSIASSTFSSAEDDDSKWCLILYPRGRSINPPSLSLYLQCVSSGYSSILAKFELSVLGQGGLKDNVREATRHFTPNSMVGFAKYIERAYLLERADSLLPNDKLTILCEVSAFIDSGNITSPGRSFGVNVPDCRLSQDLGHLLESRRCCDVIMSVAGQEIHAHKGILAARCSVFAAMFEHGMKEEKEGRVEITDCDFEVFREVVEFIYTGRAPRLSKMAEEVLVAADKYDLARLKAMCEDVLCSKLSVKSAVEMLAFADMHNADQLKANALRFIRENVTGVMETDDWKAMAGDKPHLVAAVLRSLAAENAALKAQLGSK